MKLIAVSLADVATAWVQVLPLITRMVDSAPDLELQDVWRLLRSGEGELWIAGTEEGGHEAVAVTKLRRWGLQTGAYVIGVASNDELVWRQIIPEWQAALKARGADIIIMEGRKGWERLIPGARLLRQVYEVAT